MYRSLAVAGVFVVVASVSRGGPPVPPEIPGGFLIPRPSHNVKDWGPMDYDDTPGAEPGGIVFIRKGDQRIWRFGGALFPMHLRITEPGPNGPMTSWMTLPSSGQSSAVPLALQHHPVPLKDQPLPGGRAPNRACVQVAMPDELGLLYIDGRLTDTRGTSRVIESPALDHGQRHVFRLRAAFKVGENLLIEEKEVSASSGEVLSVNFDGTRAVSVRLP